MKNLLEEKTAKILALENTEDEILSRIENLSAKLQEEEEKSELLKNEVQKLN